MCLRDIHPKTDRLPLCIIHNVLNMYFSGVCFITDAFLSFVERRYLSVNLKDNIKYELSKELFFEVGLDGIIKDVTSNCFNITGYTQDELIGCKLEKFIKDEEEINLLNSRDKYEAEIVFHHKNGRNLYMRIKKKVITNNRDKVLCICITDITEYKHELDRAKRLMRIFERANDIIFSVRIKPELKFEYLSPAVYSNLGITVEECIKNPMIPLEIVHPMNMKNIKRNLMVT